VHAVAGVMRVTARDGVWIVPPERGLWMPARVRHEIRCVGAVRMRTVYLRGVHPAFPRAPRVTRVSPLMREIMVRLAEGAGARQRPHLAALLVEEIAALDVEPLRLPRPRDARIARLCAALHENPADATTLQGWADRLALSRRTLIRRIRAETGMSFRELRRQARILAALERLSLGGAVTAVAFDVGFDSPSAFIEAFRRVTGRTPGRYMKR
jgi:AraC-like DNA-binding protein